MTTNGGIPSGTPSDDGLMSVEIKRYYDRYIGFWLYFLGVSAVTVFIAYHVYTEVLLPVWDAIDSILRFRDQIDEDFFAKYLNPILRVIAISLVTWRVVKVMVLIGSPIRIGISCLRPTNQSSKNLTPGRTAHVSFIGDRKRERNRRSVCLLCIVLRQHQRSDKLLRYRLETMIVALPFRYTLIIDNSSFFLKRASEPNVFRISRVETKIHQYVSDGVIVD